MYDDQDFDNLMTPERRSAMRDMVGILPWATDPRLPAPSEVSEAMLNVMSVVVEAAHKSGHEHERDDAVLVVKGHKLADTVAALEVESPANVPNEVLVVFVCTLLGEMLDELEDTVRESAEMYLLRAGLRVLPRLLDERAQDARGQG